MPAERASWSAPPCPHDCRHEPLLGHDDPHSARPADHAAHRQDAHHGHDHDPAHAHDASHASERHAHGHDHGHDHGHANSHAHGHDHAHAHLKHQHSYRHHDKRILLIAFLITALTMVAEIVGGWLTHSLALVSDGIHMFTHAFALGLSWAAIVLAARPANAAKTFGYYRVEVIAAFVNGITILVSAAWIVMEGIARLITPEPVAIGATLAIAVAGLVVNLITGAILMRGDQGSLNIRSAFLHMLTDTLSSVAIIVGLIVIHFTTWQWIDPLLALLVAVIIVKWSWSLIAQSLNVLMEGSTVDVGVLTAHVLAEFPEVVDMHDVHVWQIAEHFNCLTAHVTIRADTVAGYTTLVQRINASLKQNFEIGHINLQPEFA